MFICILEVNTMEMWNSTI